LQITWKGGEVYFSEKGVKPAVPWASLPAREQAAVNARAKRINDGLGQDIATASQKRKNKKH
jgi:hypothetical protein